MKILWVALCVLLSASSFGESDSNSIAELLKLAESGDAQAQFKLGKRYGKGDGVATNAVEAVKWYRKAADQGNTDAQFYLGECCFFGCGVATNKEEGVKWLQKSATQGNVYALEFLGDCYEYGIGVEKNEAEAVRLYSELAGQTASSPEKLESKLEAMRRLRVCYMEGRGVKKSMMAAVILQYDIWCKKYPWVPSVSICIVVLLVGLSICDRVRELISEKKLLRKANAGDADAMFRVALNYGPFFYSQEKMEWYRKAAEHGHSEAQFRLGKGYFNGSGVEKDEAEAVKWYRKAAEQGHLGAKIALDELGVR